MLTDVNLHDFLAFVSTALVCLLLLHRPEEGEEERNDSVWSCYVIWSNRRRINRADGVALI